MESGMRQPLTEAMNAFRDARPRAWSNYLKDPQLETDQEITRSSVIHDTPYGSED